MADENKLIGMPYVAKKYNLTLHNIQKTRNLIEKSFRCNPHVIPLVIGDAGVGKTVIIKDIATELDVPYLIIKLANLEKEDMVGYIHLSTDGETYNFVPHQDIPKYLKDPNTIIFFDEINRGQLPTIKAFFNVIDERKFGDFKLPEETKMVAAMNPPDKNYHVNDILAEAALRKRFRIMCCKADAATYINYIKHSGKEKGHGYVIEFLETHPSYTYDYDALNSGQVFTSPHGWSRVSETCFNMDENYPGWDKEDLLSDLGYLIEGDINATYADLFCSFVRDVSVAIKPKDIVTKYAKVAKRIQRLITSHRHDVLAESAVAVGTYLLGERPDVKKVADNYCQFLAVLPEDISGSLNHQLVTESQDDDQRRKYYLDLNAEIVKQDDDGNFIYTGYVQFYEKLNTLDDKFTDIA